MTGIELLKHACATKSRARFILMTAAPATAPAIQALILGAYGSVIKTDSLVEELCSTVEEVLKNEGAQH
jgi:DNA-binding NtrC family response regulator